VKKSENSMASSPKNPQVGHSLWLQRRSGGPSARRVCWRSNWTPVGLVVLLLALLVLLSLLLPVNEVERLKHAAQDDNTSNTKYPSVVGVLSEP
jgi:hypothetical protein